MAAGKRPKSMPNGANSKPAGVDPTEIRTRDLGAALRAAYESAVQEEIPAEMLDLLNKLR